MRQRPKHALANAAEISIAKTSIRACVEERAEFENVLTVDELRFSNWFIGIHVQQERPEGARPNPIEVFA